MLGSPAHGDVRRWLGDVALLGALACAGDFGERVDAWLLGDGSGEMAEPRAGDC
jgi:hypothetical protein